LVTAADGADSFYASLSNDARYESANEAMQKDKALRTAYMGHQKWFLIDNNVNDFNEKISRAKQAVHDILGSPIGPLFYKKFLLKKAKNTKLNVMTVMPLDFSVMTKDYEEITIIEDFIDYQSHEGEVIESSIERRGGAVGSFSYYHKMQILKRGQILHKKRNISATEYLKLMDFKQKHRKELIVTRICTIHDGLYCIIDYYENVDGQPLVLLM
jgi:hypothetical protein